MRRSLGFVFAAGTAVLVSLGTAAVTVDAQPKKPGAEKKSEPKKAPMTEKAAGKVEPKAVKGGDPKKKDEGAPEVVSVKSEGDAGVKTYKFGPVEVEGRLKSPQIIYFLRRVRAEFSAGRLGHRSFMRELSDTRRSPALK